VPQQRPRPSRSTSNLGVILAGALGAWTGSNLPDLVIGTLIGLLVLNGARRILQLKA
jgi:Co/Zn/Cd efflux system component